MKIDGIIPYLGTWKVIDISIKKIIEIKKELKTTLFSIDFKNINNFTLLNFKKNFWNV